MHAQIATALEARHAHRIDEHLDELAYHFTEGALAGERTRPSSTAAERASGPTTSSRSKARSRTTSGRLSALELVDVPDPIVRCDLQLALAIALFNAGDERRRVAVFAAAASARALGDGERLAAAALVLTMGGGTSDAQFDGDLVALLEDSLTAVGDAPTGLRAQLLSSLATELQWSPQVERRMQLARESLTVAPGIARSHRPHTRAHSRGGPCSMARNRWSASSKR